MWGPHNSNINNCRKEFQFWELESRLAGYEHWLFQRTPVEFSATRWQLTVTSNCRPRGSDALCWSLWALHTKWCAVIHAGKTPMDA